MLTRTLTAVGSRIVKEADSRIDSWAGTDETQTNDVEGKVTEQKPEKVTILSPKNEQEPVELLKETKTESVETVSIPSETPEQAPTKVLEPV